MDLNEDGSRGGMRNDGGSRTAVRHSVPQHHSSQLLNLCAPFLPSLTGTGLR